MKKLKTRFAACMLAASFLHMPPLLLSATAQSVTLSGNAAGQQTIHVIEQPLPEVLRQAARRTGYQITMTSRVRGTLQKVTLPLDMEKLLQQIAPQFDLKWHFQENQLYVSVASENTTRMIFLGKTKMEDLESALEAAQFKAEGGNLTHVKETNSVIINGPVSYVAGVELLAESLTKNNKAKRDTMKIIRFGNVSNN